jgi:hypothetical protein
MVTNELESNPRQRERIGIIQSLAAGTVPSTGLRRLQVGRTEELEAVVEDLKLAEAGVSTVRFIAGAPESGKTFFLNLARAVAVERGFLVVRAEFSTARRLHSSSGEARAFYRALMTHISTEDGPEGVPLGRVIQRWIDELEHSVRAGGGDEEQLRNRVSEAVRPLYEYAGGFDFATVLLRYHQGHVAHDDELREHALRWLRAEYEDKSGAYQDLGVRSIIDDPSVKDALNLFAAFVKLAGYSGLLVVGDDLTALSRRLSDGSERSGNYDTIVHMHDDCLQGRSKWMVVLFGVEDHCVEDRQRGLYSNAVLATWLAPNRFASSGHRDLASPVIRLEGLEPDDYPALLTKVRDVFAGPGRGEQLIPQAGIQEYARTCAERMGETYFDTPREVVKDFIDLLHLLAQDSGADWRDLVASAETSVAGAGADYVYLPGATRPGGVNWYLPPLEEDREASGSPLRMVAAVVIPLFVFGLALLGWRLMTPATPAFAAELQVKFSDFRGGLRRPLDEANIPLRIGNFFSVAVEDSPGPFYMYVLVVDTDGKVEWKYGHDGAHAPAVDLQLPGADKMWPLGEPAGTRTVLLFASKTPIADPALFKARVEALRPLPVTSPASMFILSGDSTEEIHSLLLRDGAYGETESDCGFLLTLSEEFGDRFEIIRAVSFPVLPAAVHQPRTIFEFED